MRIVITSKKEKVQLLDAWAAMLKKYRKIEMIDIWALDDIQEAICDTFWTSKFSARKTHLKWVVYCRSYPKKFHYRGYRFQPRYNTHRKKKKGLTKAPIHSIIESQRERGGIKK